MEHPSVKVFGERNTGTNLLARLIEANSQSCCLPGVEDALDSAAFRRATAKIPLTRYFLFGNRLRNRLFDRVFANRGPLECWKHCATNFEDVSAFEGVFVLLAVRHPGSWLVSLFRRQYHRISPRPRSLKQFIEMPWRTVGRERLGGASYRPFELYKRKIEANLEFSSRLSSLGIENEFVRFEDLVASQEAVFEASLRAHLFCPSDQFDEILESTKDPAMSARDYRSYYAEKRWMEAVTGLEPDINASVDWDQLEPFGYKPL